MLKMLFVCQVAFRLVIWLWHCSKGSRRAVHGYATVDGGIRDPDQP